jgi:Fe-S cluster biosynthesis and repair protein YggX
MNRIRRAGWNGVRTESKKHTAADSEADSRDGTIYRQNYSRFHALERRTGIRVRRGVTMVYMSTPRIVHCIKLKKDLPGLESPPWPGALGQRIFESVSAQAWKQWEERQKMILNEYRLMPWQKEAQELIARHLEEFFFGENAAMPPGYVPETK